MVKTHFKPFEKMAALIYIPTNSGQGVPFLYQYCPHQHLLPLVFLIIVILTGVR